MQYYQMSKEQLDSFLKTNDQFDFQNNKESDSKKIRIFLKIISECKEKNSFVLILLIIGHLINAVFSVLNREWNLLLIGAILFLCSCIFTVLECSFVYLLKNKYNERIKKEENNIKVIRNESTVEISMYELRCGDRIFLKKGTILPADARIIADEHLYVNEELVFGKTIPTLKTSCVIEQENLHPEEQGNMVWKGSYVSEGCGEALIIALGGDCYIEKTGGREERRQKSAIFNQKNNIGRTARIIFIIISTLLLILAGLITGKWLEAMLVYCSFLSLFVVEPVSFLTEWIYYNTAEKFQCRGVLIRNIQAFDGMNKEKTIHIKSSELLEKAMNTDVLLNISGSEVINRSIYTKCFDFSSVINNATFSIYTDEAESFVVACGYWKEILPYISTLDDELLRQINEYELHGRSAYFLAASEIDFIPKHLKKEDYLGKLSFRVLILMQPKLNQELQQKIGRLRKSGVCICLNNQHSAELGNYLSSTYDLDQVLAESLSKESYSEPETSKTTVYENASQIDKKNAMVIFSKKAVPLNVIYETKCMICGLERSLNYMFITAFALMFSSFAVFLIQKQTAELAFPLMMMQPLLFFFCYHIVASVKNCRQNKLSLVFGGLFAIVFFISSFMIGAGALCAFSLSLVLYSIALFIRRIKYFGWTKIEIIIMAIALAWSIVPWFFIAFNYSIAVLLALFPVLATIMIDYLY